VAAGGIAHHHLVAPVAVDVAEDEMYDVELIDDE
jgi:hypothetical protein